MDIYKCRAHFESDGRVASLKVWSAWGIISRFWVNNHSCPVGAMWSHSGAVASTVTSEVMGLNPPAGAFLCGVYMFSVSVWVLSKHTQVWLTGNSDMTGINLHVNDYLSILSCIRLVTHPGATCLSPNVSWGRLQVSVTLHRRKWYR